MTETWPVVRQGLGAAPKCRPTDLSTVRRDKEGYTVGGLRQAQLVLQDLQSPEVSVVLGGVALVVIAAELANDTRKTPIHQGV